MAFSLQDLCASAPATNHRGSTAVSVPDLDEARRVQQQLLPRAIQPPPGWDIAAAYRPARIVSGDYCDVIDLGEGQIAFAIGDVSGKGLGPALVMAGLRAWIHARLPQSTASFAELMQELNLYLLATTPDDMFVTLFLAVLDVCTGRFRYVNAGHIPPLLLAGLDADPMRFTASGPVLGILPDVTFEAHDIGIKPGSLLAVFSDGITEAVNTAGKMFHERRAVEVLREGLAKSATHTLTHLLQAVESFTLRTEQADDISIILLQRIKEPALPATAV
jgi:sigma-B regulation protein RsbU (phosphoserine phosphatase)